MILLAIGMPAIIALMRVERTPKSHEAGARGHHTARDWTRGEVVRDPILYLLLSGTLAPAFIATVIFFNQGYLIQLRGYDPLVFAGAFSLMSATTVVFGFVCGPLIDRLAR